MAEQGHNFKNRFALAGKLGSILVPEIMKTPRMLFKFPGFPFQEFRVACPVGEYPLPLEFFAL